MRFVLYTHRYSPHEMPLFQACADCFDDAVYVVDCAWDHDPSRAGWQPDLRGRRTLVLEALPAEARESALRQLLDAETLILYGLRGNPFECMICASGALVIYASERWLKTTRRSVLGWTVKLPGVLHGLSGSFRRQVAFVRHQLATNRRFFYFGEGLHACRDMARLTESPLREESTAGWNPTDVVDVAGRIRAWGYFVDTTTWEGEPRQRMPDEPLRLLWVGRMIGVKRLDTLVEAVRLLNHGDSKGVGVTLTLLGDGPELPHLKKCAAGLPVAFRGYVPMQEVRRLMHDFDVYVFPSEEGEGWGAVINEALEEGLAVLCSRGAGAGVTMLPEACLFEVGAARELADKLRRPVPRVGIGSWNVRAAARALYDFALFQAKNLV